MWPFGHISLLGVAREKIRNRISHIAADTVIVSIGAAINADALRRMSQNETCASDTFAQGVKRIPVIDCEESANHGDSSLRWLQLLYALIRAR